MTRRHTREEKERMQLAIEFTRQGFTSFTRSLVEIVIMAGIAGGLTQTVQDDFTRILAGAGWAAIAVMFLSIAIAAVVILGWIGSRPEQAQPDSDRVGHVAGGWYLTAAEGWEWEMQRDYLCDVDAGRARFSQDGAAAWGDVTPDEFNALLHRMVDLGLYTTRNAGRYDHGNSGDWTERGKEMLAGIRNGE